MPLPSPMCESESEVTQSCPTRSDPVDCSLPGSSVHGFFQARGLEWGAIAFSDGPTWKNVKFIFLDEGFLFVLLHFCIFSELFTRDQYSLLI